ncbi:PilW family protein [Endozoicomonas sp. SM1973]|uniref:PilW family protein n=1 Tax=Spartinivicinus marinus TaxID=2994442 RepID=A0A853I543_9GAMM|nr:PilW family protein [Spartinivicinus marinus]MCX4026043.1 PilW family protein [Spartinivicinus marinus]NYZ69020.1 PilW family protein [Spartinivicinus marinus]
MKIYKIHKIRGFTIVEMMISLVLGALLLGGIISLFTNNHRTYLIIQSTANLQDNARFVIDVISEDIRMAGYYGCLSKRTDPVYNPSLLQTGLNIDFLFKNYFLGIKGFEAASTMAWQPELPELLTRLNPAPLEGSDIITIKRIVNNGAKLSSLNESERTMKLVEESLFKKNDVAIISDCEKATLFQISSVNSSGNNQVIQYQVNGGTPGNQNIPISTGASYIPNSSNVYLFASRVYYIAPAWDIVNNQAITNNMGKPVFSLWRLQGIDTIGNPLTQELVRGVENLQMTYGVDSSPASPKVGDDRIDQYLNADRVDQIDNGFERVIAVKIELTVNSIDSIGSKNDGVLRKTLSHIVKIRNRGS